MSSGIYRITNLVNEKYYIGSAVDLDKRKASHFNKSTNIHLQRAIERYGKDNFLWEVLEECSKENLVEREQYWMNRHDFGDLYNIAPKAGSKLGVKFSEETKKKISESKKATRNSKNIKIDV